LNFRISLFKILFRLEQQQQEPVVDSCATGQTSGSVDRYLYFRNNCMMLLANVALLFLDISVQRETNIYVFFPLKIYSQHAGSGIGFEERC
jgi:hypothetical protein